MRSAPRCERCWQRQDSCICAALTPLPTRTRLLILRHQSERRRPSSTARLAALLLPAVRIVDYGDGPLPDLDLADSWLLFPDGPALSVAPSPPPAQLVILDGTWTQARRMRNRVSALATLPRFSLPPADRPLPRLRRQSLPEGMSTLDAIGRALALLEGDAVLAPIEAVLQRVVDRANETQRRTETRTNRSQGTGHRSQATGNERKEEP